MFRYLIVFLEILLLVLVLRTSYAQHMLSNTQMSLSSWLASVSNTVDKLALSELRESLHPMTDNMRDYEVDYIEELFADKSRLLQFHHLYCVEGDKNPYVYGDNLLEMCRQLKQSQVLNTKTG